MSRSRNAAPRRRRMRKTAHRMFCRRCSRELVAGQAVVSSRGGLVHDSCSSAAVIATVHAASAGQQ